MHSKYFGDIHRDTWRKYAYNRGTVGGSVFSAFHPEVILTGQLSAFRNNGDTQTYRQQDDIISLLLYFKNKGSTLTKPFQNISISDHIPV
jgi:hypothetical protein